MFEIEPHQKILSSRKPKLVKYSYSILKYKTMGTVSQEDAFQDEVLSSSRATSLLFLVRSLVITIDCISFWKVRHFFFAPLLPRNLWCSVVSARSLCDRIGEMCLIKWPLSVVVSRSNDRACRCSISDVRSSGGGFDCAQVCDKTRMKGKKKERKKNTKKQSTRVHKKNLQCASFFSFFFFLVFF